MVWYRKGYEKGCSEWPSACTDYTKNDKPNNQETEHLFARIFDRDFAEFLLFILLEQMFARGARAWVNALTIESCW